MKALDAFFESTENQKRYGFECRKESSGCISIIYDGDFSILMDIAYETAGYQRIDTSVEDTDSRQTLSFVLKSEKLINTENSAPVEFGVDGVGDEPNFYLCFQSGGKSVVIRLSMIAPKIYPDGVSCLFRFSLDSLSAINGLYRAKCDTLIERWNSLRPDLSISDQFIPNYRAINRVVRNGH